MTKYPNISMTAQLMGDPTRTSILTNLADGRALTAGELATLAGVSPQTASAHLTKLLDGFLITMEKQGRHRYYRLANAEVADAIEAIAVISPPLKVQSLRESSHQKALDFARTCYGHLAGRLGVALTQAIVERGYFEDTGQAYKVTNKGKQWLGQFGIDSFSQKIALDDVPQHIDWTVRKHHMAGPLALAITRRLLELGWIEQGRIRRSIVITEIGRAGFLEEFGFYPDLE